MHVCPPPAACSGANHGLLSKAIVPLQHAKLETRGEVGGRTLIYLLLSAVLKPPLPLSLLPAKWLGLW